MVAEVLGYIGALAVLATFSSRTMVPLRISAIASNCTFIAYGYLTALYPILFLHLFLLPVNAVRLYQMVRLMNRVKAAAAGDLTMDWLKPFMARKSYSLGDLVFGAGEAAEHLYFVVRGRFKVVELNVECGPGEVIGEMGLVSPGQRRTATVRCVASGELLSISYDSVLQLYFQNPEFGFYFLRLVSARLFSNLERLQATTLPTPVVATPD